MTDALFVSAPVRFGLTVPLIVIVSVLTAPGASVAFVKETVLPDELFVPQLPNPTSVQFAVTPVIGAGTTSLMLNAVASDGPALVTTSV